VTYYHSKIILYLWKIFLMPICEFFQLSTSRHVYVHLTIRNNKRSSIRFFFLTISVIIKKFSLYYMRLAKRKIFWFHFKTIQKISVGHNAVRCSSCICILFKIRFGTNMFHELFIDFHFENCWRIILHIFFYTFCILF